MVSILAGCGGATDDPPFFVWNGEGPLYVISNNVLSSGLDRSTSYLAFVDDLDAGEVNIGRSIEFTGGASLWGVPKSGEFYVAAAESRTITKFRVAATGTLEQVGRVGLARRGVTRLFAEVMAFDGPDRGYLFDLVSGQAIELDLKAMEIVRSIDLSSKLVLNRDPRSSMRTFFADPGFRPWGDRLIAVTYEANIEQQTVSNISRVVFFDPRDASIDVREAPCAGVVYSVVAPSGDLFLSTDPWVAGVHFLDNTRAPRPCMARVTRGSTTAVAVDKFWLNDLTGGAPTGGLIPSANGRALLRVLDTAAFQLTPDTTVLQLFGARAWNTWRIDLSSPATSAERMDRPHLAGGIKFFEVDGQVYENDSAADFGRTTLVRTTGKMPFSPGIRVPGITFGVLRLR